MPETDEIAYLELVEVAELIRTRQLTSTEVTEAILARIERYDPVLKSYATVMADSALNSARQADEEIARGRYRGPLHGVPVAVKDLANTHDAPTAGGGTLLRNFIPEADATVVARLRAAGAVLTGKLRMTEGAYTEHHPDLDAPVNPWNAEAWTGSSSSGSGVATSAGLCFASLGSDTGGSIRLPSSMCGVTGVKPTWGRVSRHGILELAASLDHVGPMTRSAADAAAVLAVIAGIDVNDPTSSVEPVPDYANLLKLQRSPRVGVDRELLGTFDAATRAALLEVEAVMRDAGWHIIEVKTPSFQRMGEIFEPLCAVETAVAHEPFFDAHSPAYGPALAHLIRQGRLMPASDLHKLQEERRAFTGRMHVLFQSIDLLLVPGMGLPAPTKDMLGVWATNPEVLAKMIVPTAPFDLCGFPTITLPGGMSDIGTPFGFQLAGSPFSESLLFAAADAFQQLTVHHRQHPRLVAPELTLA